MMDDLSPFATHYAHLVWLLSQRPDWVDAQKEQLRQAVAQLSAEAARIGLHDVAMALSTRISAGDTADGLVPLGELSMRMSAHSVRALEFEPATPARELLDVARALASLPTPGDGGEAFDRQLVSLSLTGITAHLGEAGFVRGPSTGMPQSAATTRTPAASMLAIPTPVRPMRAEQVTPEALRPLPRPSQEDQALMKRQLAPLTTPEADVSDLISRLDQAEAAPNPAIVIEDIARAAEDRARQGRWTELVDVLRRLHEHHDRQHDGDTKRAFLLGIRRLEKPALLHGVARMLPQHRELRDALSQLLARAGELGAEALIDNLIASDVAAERRAYRGALAQCPAAVTSLLHLLRDNRWFVVRNAVELLGELAPPDVDDALGEQLSHQERRVRRAAAVALGRIGTPRAVLALLQAIGDPSPDVRLQVAHALGATRTARAVPWIVEALDAESDADVQAALIAALGRTPTEESVARLIRLSEPGGLLLRRPVPLRLRAVEALGEAGTPPALEALRGLLQDRDREVREAAHQAISRASRQPAAAL